MFFPMQYTRALFTIIKGIILDYSYWIAKLFRGFKKQLT